MATSSKNSVFSNPGDLAMHELALRMERQAHALAISGRVMGLEATVQERGIN